MSDGDGVDGGPVGLTGSIYMRKAEFASSPTLQAGAGSGNLERSTIDAPHLELSKAAFFFGEMRPRNQELGGKAVAEPLVSHPVVQKFLALSP